MTLNSLAARLRFWNKVEAGDGCWVWLGALEHRGYGKFWLSGRHVAAHRFAYETCVGPIPEGLCVDHLCGDKRCVNPAHMETVTSRENTLRCGKAPASINARKTACPKGHPYDEANTYFSPSSRGGRHCRACQRVTTPLPPTETEPGERPWDKAAEDAAEVRRVTFEDPDPSDEEKLLGRRPLSDLWGEDLDWVR
jgi:hypothetical protein